MAPPFPKTNAEAVLGMLQRVADESISGQVHLARADGEAATVLEVFVGRIVGVQRPEGQPRMPLILALYKSGKLEAALLNQSVPAAREADVSPERWLIDAGHLDEGHLQGARIFRDSEEILDALTALVSAVTIQPLPPEQSAGVAGAAGFEAHMLAGEVQRRLAEWEPLRRYLPDDNDVPRPARTVTDRTKELAAGLDELAQTLARRADGQQTATELITAAPTTAHKARIALANVIKTGLLERLPPRKLIKVAHAAENKRKLDKALRIYNLITRRGGERVDFHDVAIRTARIYERLGLAVEARDAYVREAHALRDDKRLEAAANTMRRACKLAGASAGPLQSRLVRWLIEDGELDDAREELVDLIETQGASPDPAVRTAIGDAARSYLAARPEDVAMHNAASPYLSQ